MCLRSCSSLRGVGEERPRDHDALDLAGAFVDTLDSRVAPVALYRVVAGVAVAAVELHRVVADAACSLRGVELGHRGLAGEGSPLLLEPRGAVGQQARGGELAGHVGELELRGLE